MAITDQILALSVPTSRDADVLTVAERGGLDGRRARQVLEEMRAEVAAGL